MRRGASVKKSLISRGLSGKSEVASVNASASWRISVDGLQYGQRASNGFRITSPRVGVANSFVNSRAGS